MMQVYTVFPIFHNTTKRTLIVFLFQVHVIAPQKNLGDQLLAPEPSVIPPVQLALVGNEYTQTSTTAQKIPVTVSDSVSIETPVPLQSPSLGSPSNQSLLPPAAMCLTASPSLIASMPSVQTELQTSPTVEVLPLTSAPLLHTSAPGSSQTPSAAALAQAQNAATPEMAALHQRD